MKRFFVQIAIFILMIAMPLATASAAANPIPSTSSSSTTTVTPNGIPPAYLQSVKLLQENRYGENEIKSFVYQVFSLFDRHVEVSQILFLFTDQDLEVRLPEGLISTQKDLEKWYAGIGAKYQSNTHTLERVDVNIPAKGDYRIDLIVHWQALDREGKYSSSRFHQQWRVVDGGGYWPRIVSYIVEPIH
jgi:hypothetical protein